MTDSDQHSSSLAATMSSSTDSTKTQLKDVEFELNWQTKDEIVGNLSQHTTLLSGLIVNEDSREKLRKANADLVVVLLNLPLKVDGRSRSFESLGHGPGDGPNQVVLDMTWVIRSRVLDALITNHHVALQVDSASSDCKSKLIEENNDLICELVKLKSRTVAIPTDSSASNGGHLIGQATKLSEKSVEKPATGPRASSQIVEEVSILKKEIEKLKAQMACKPAYSPVHLHRPNVFDYRKKTGFGSANKKNQKLLFGNSSIGLGTSTTNTQVGKTQQSSNDSLFHLVTNKPQAKPRTSIFASSATGKFDSSSSLFSWPDSDANIGKYVFFRSKAIDDFKSVTSSTNLFGKSTVPNVVRNDDRLPTSQPADEQSAESDQGLVQQAEHPVQVEESDHDDRDQNEGDLDLQSSVICCFDKIDRGLKRKLDDSRGELVKPKIENGGMDVGRNGTTFTFKLPGVEDLLARTFPWVAPSDLFYCRGIPWYLKIFHNRDDEVDHIGVELFHNSIFDNRSWSALTSFEIRLLSVDPACDVVEKFEHKQFKKSDSSTGCGSSKFVSIEQLRSGSFIQDDSIQVRVHLTIQELERSD